jgi:hypothetical protein
VSGVAPEDLAALLPGALLSSSSLGLEQGPTPEATTAAAAACRAMHLKLCSEAPGGMLAAATKALQSEQLTPRHVEAWIPPDFDPTGRCQGGSAATQNQCQQPG